MADDASASEQFDLTTGMSFTLEAAQVRDMASHLEEAESYPAASADSDTLAEFVSALKRLENAAEEARKDVFEAELSDRVDEGETVGDVRKTSGSNRYVTDHAAAFDAVLDAGEDPREVAKVSASNLADLLGDDADEFIGESSYHYFRRQ